MKGALLALLIAGAVVFFLIKKQSEQTIMVAEKGISAIEKAKNTAQFAGWSHISQALAHYLNDHGSYPDSLEELIPHYLPNRSHIRDPWGTPLRYEKDDASATLVSAGPDREFETDDDQSKTI
jgi:hypothetical protein